AGGPRVHDGDARLAGRHRSPPRRLAGGPHGRRGGGTRSGDLAAEQDAHQSARLPEDLCRLLRRGDRLRAPARPRHPPRAGPTRERTRPGRVRAPAPAGVELGPPRGNGPNRHSAEHKPKRSRLLTQSQPTPFLGLNPIAVQDEEGQVASGVVSAGVRSSRRPLKDGWRRRLSGVQRVYSTSATSSGRTQTAVRAASAGTSSNGDSAARSGTSRRSSRSSVAAEKPVPTWPAYRNAVPPAMEGAATSGSPLAVDSPEVREGCADWDGPVAGDTSRDAPLGSGPAWERDG